MTSEDWEKVSSRLRAVFNLGIEKTEWLQRCRLARLIAAVPFLAGCDKALETSFTHLAVYYMSIDDLSKDIYFHKSDDDGNLYSRLSPIGNFTGGDQRIIDCCMDLIALNMLTNYKKDSVEDAANGKYNPVATGSWDYELQFRQLLERIDKNITSDINAFYTVEEALGGGWQC